MTPQPTPTGLSVPVLTPFDEKLRIDEDMLTAQLEFLTQAGVRQILVNGTNGEFFSLTREEKRRTFEIARRDFDGRILFHPGTASLEEAIGESRFAQEHGADGIMALTPFYLQGAPEDGIVEYLNTLSQSLEIPFFIYNFPRHTQNPLTPEILKRVDHAGIKDSSHDSSLIPHTPLYLVGGDAFILATRKLGGHGCISAQSNHAPELFLALEKAIEGGEMEKADNLQKEVTYLTQILGGNGVSARIKKALSLRIPNYPTRVRSPLLPLNDLDMDRIKKYQKYIHARPEALS